MISKKNYKNELEKLDTFERKRVEKHMQLVMVCVSWFHNNDVNYTTTELLKMVELANAELERN